MLWVVFMPKLMFRPPRLRVSEGGEEERHATWMELFYDLLFAAVVAQLSLQLSHDLAPFGILKFALLFVPVWWAWIGQAFYATRFDTDDLGHRLFIMLSTCPSASPSSPSLSWENPLPA
jgi:low temperature requirement protein LtrA